MFGGRHRRRLWGIVPWEFAHKWQRCFTAYMLQRNAPDITPRRLLCHAARIVSSFTEFVIKKERAGVFCSCHINTKQFFACWEIFCIFVVSLRNTQCFRWHLGLLFREVKRPKLLNEQTIGTLNAHALWRGCAYVRMGAWSYLLDVRHYPRFFF